MDDKLPTSVVPAASTYRVNHKRISLKRELSHAPKLCKKLSVRISNVILREAHKKVGLKQNIGLSGAIGIIVGNVIGSGIFISPKGVLKGSGSVGLSLVIWGICGLVTLLGALSYAELGTRITDAGGSYIYLLEGLAPNRKKQKTFWGPVPAFLFNWQSILFSVPASMAIISLTCGEYLVKLTSTNCAAHTSPETAVKLIACCVLCLVAAINCYSVKASTYLQIVFASAKVLALLLIIISGTVTMASGTLGELTQGFQHTKTSFGDIALAFYSGLWAFNGWQNLNFVTKEMKNPSRDLPLAIIGATIFAAIFYLLINVSYLVVLTTQELLESETVAVGFGYKVAGKAGGIVMILFVALTTFGSANSGCFTSGRLCYASAKEGHMIDVLSYIHKDKNTPTSAIMFNLLIGVLMILPTNLESLIALNGFIAWMFIGATQLSLLTLKFNDTTNYHQLRVPAIIPVTVLMFSCFLVMTPLIIEPRLEYFYVVGFLFLGFLAYVVFVYYEVACYGTKTLTIWLQALLYIVPPEN